ncbi:hypothetical protein [Xanthomarina gelatinilytica]|uniref:hypothetical protein n=1 Tax=Xanthomarina gelatinilytica TaxID=1137281 RepID=UPI003AA876B5
MEVINPNEIGAKISTLISEANEKFYAITPFLDLSKWKKILINLENAIKRDVEVKFYFREIKEKDFQILYKLGIELNQINGLHTKLYINESETIVSSMNLYEFSDLYSIDIALHFKENKDYNKIYSYFIKYILSKNNKSYVSKNEKDKLTSLHSFLENRFSTYKINKGSDYIYTKNLVPIFHLFIEPTKIGIKYPEKNPNEEILIELRKKIKRVYKEKTFERSYSTGIDRVSGNTYYLWEINLLENDFLTFSNIICDLQKIE